AIAQPAGNLPAGRYDIVMDQCLDGYYDPGVDIVLGDGPGFAFEVVIPGPLPPINYSPLKKSAANYAAVLKGLEISTPAGDLPKTPGFCDLFNKWVKDANVAPSTPLGIWGNIAAAKCGDLTKHWEAIAKDPPDPNFQSVADL